MQLLSSVQIAARAIGRNRLRSALTLLGVSIGVAVVIVMVAIGTGAQRSIEQRVRAAGANLVTVNAGNYSPGDLDPSSGDVAETVGGRIQRGRIFVDAVLHAQIQAGLKNISHLPCAIDEDPFLQSRIRAGRRESVRDLVRE